MAWSYQIDLAGRRVLSTYSGVITDSDLAEHMEALSLEPDFCEDFDQLVEVSSDSLIEVTREGIRSNVDSHPFGSGSRRAIVVVTDVGFGMSRMFQILRDANPDEVGVFRSKEEALRWLAEDPDPPA
jgi:hypothetical protein